MGKPPSDVTTKENQGWLDVYRMFIQRWTEINIAELDRDKERMPDVDLFEQLYYRAKWEKYTEVMTSVVRVLERYTSDHGKSELVAWMFGERLDIPGASIPMDVEQRLNWYKQRLAYQYDRQVRATLATSGVSSPIEQLFVMEWHYQRVDERFDVQLRPQTSIEAGSTKVRIDFVVNRSESRMPLAIELDGHEFHEKTKEQAAHDRKRERAIVRAGYRVIRFTGHEVFRDPGGCVREVIELIQKPEPSDGRRSGRC